jgi:hypothetical protein
MRKKDGHDTSWKDQNVTFVPPPTLRDPAMNPTATKNASDEETSYDQVNAKCREISWPERTSLMADCNVMPDSIEMDDDAWRDTIQRFWNQYLYPAYEKTYFTRYPDDRARLKHPESMRGRRLLDYHRKMVLALCDWLDENGCFHYFDDQVVFVKYDGFALSMGDLLTAGVPLHIYKRDRIPQLLNGLLDRCVHLRHREETAVKWAIGLGIAAGLLALVLLGLITT